MEASSSSGDAGVEWRSLGKLLESELVLLPAAVRVEASTAHGSITEAEARLDDRLVVGIVGGTGVGKSTLINALAGREVSRSGDRRPTTDRVVVYRHERTALPDELPRGDLADADRTHEVADLERVVLLDFPDFDSVESLHHEILGRHLPHLDVLLVVVDDMKYGDLRLYELLARLPQSPQNVRGVLNKVDRLERRYPGRWRAVADEILDDFGIKLREHAGIVLSGDHRMALSALTVLQRRLAAAAPAAPSPRQDAAASTEGDFGRLSGFLRELRVEKRRRAAKALNLEARKEALRASLRPWTASSEAWALVEEARRRVEARRSELAGVLAGLSPAILTAAERRGLTGEALSRAAARLGFPIDVLVGWSAALRLRRLVDRSGRPSLTPGRIAERYASLLASATNGEREAALALQLAPGEGRPVLDEARTRLERRLDPAALDVAINRCDAALASRRRLWNHLLPVSIVVMSLWGLVYPAVRRLLLGDEGGEASWSAIAREALGAMVGALHPFTILGFAASILLAYGITALLVRARHAQRLDAAVHAEEDRWRRLALAEAEKGLLAWRGWMERWERERQELGRLCAAPRDGA